VDLRTARVAGQGTLSGFPCAMNNRLRTGADKWELVVGSVVLAAVLLTKATARGWRPGRKS